MKASFRLAQAYTSPPKSLLAPPSSPRVRPMRPESPRGRRSSIASNSDEGEDHTRRLRMGSFLKVLEEDEEGEVDGRDLPTAWERALSLVFGITKGDVRQGIPRSRCIHPWSFFYRGGARVHSASFRLRCNWCLSLPLHSGTDSFDDRMTY